MRHLRVLCLVLICVAVGCSSGATVPTVIRHNRPNVISEPSELVAALKSRCASNRGRVRLDLVQGNVHLRPIFACAALRNNPTAAQAELVNLVAHRDNATQRAERIETFQRQLGVPVFPPALLVWPLGTVGDYSCTDAGDTALQRRDIQSVAGYQSPLTWTKIEAARVAGDCPDRLKLFFSSITAAGYPTAASSVRAQLEKLGLRS
jgi:hypothetical protein